MQARRAAYFQGLGIDVWVRRSQRPATSPRPAPPASASRPLAGQAATTRSARQAAATPSKTAAQAPQAFRIRCFRYGRVFVALAEDAWPLRRYLLDVAKAMNGFKAAQRKDMVFEWPQPGADPAGAARAFRAFVGHQTGDGERALISGRRVLELLGGRATETGLVDGRLYVAPDAPDATAKKSLWRVIRDLEV